jgi:Flp pilus assembly protein TadB
MTTPFPGQPELRIGDEEREAAVAALGEHYAAGRLTKEEYDERAERAFAARTRSQLLPLFADLPRPVGAPGAARQERPVGAGPRRGHPGWWAGAWLAPLLAIVVALVILTHLPLFLLAVVAWIFFARMGRHWARNRGYRHGYHQRHPGQWVR